MGDDVILAAKNVCLDMIDYNWWYPLHFNTNTTCKEYVNTIYYKMSEVDKGADREQVQKDLQAVQEAYQQLEEKYPRILTDPHRAIITDWLKEQFAKEDASAYKHRRP